MPYMLRWLAPYLKANVLRMFFLGVASGLPLLLVFSAPSLWLRENGWSLTQIGFVGLAQLVFSVKFLWASVFDFCKVPVLGCFFGLRKGWLVVLQLLLALMLFAMGVMGGQGSFNELILFAVLLAFFAASQDICIDAWRIDVASAREQGVLNSVYVGGYRFGMILASGVLLSIVHYAKQLTGDSNFSWKMGYWLMAGVMLMIFLATLFFVNKKDSTQKKLDDSYGFWGRLGRLVYVPIYDFFKRYGYQALGLLALGITLRMSDILLGSLAAVFYQDIGFSLGQIATYSKTFGLLVTLIGGGLLGGLLINAFGIYRVLFVSAFLSAATNFLFVGLFYVGNSALALVVVIILDNLSGGVATLASVAFLSGLVNKQYSAAQYAVFSSVVIIVPKFLSGASGWLVDMLGYPFFFIVTALFGLPVLILIYCLRYPIQGLK